MTNKNAPVALYQGRTINCITGYDSAAPAPVEVSGFEMCLAALRSGWRS